MPEQNSQLPHNDMAFLDDTRIIGEQTERFLELVYPGYLADRTRPLDRYLENDSSLLLESMTFFRIARCSVEDPQHVFAEVNAKMEKALTALHAIDVPVCFGIISRNGVTSLVLGIYSSHDVPQVEGIVRGMLSGIELEPCSAKFRRSAPDQKCYGILSGVPSLHPGGEHQRFSLSSIMRTLNGEEYTLLFLAKPVNTETVQKRIEELLRIKDNAFAVSKRNLARNTSRTDSDTHAVTNTNAKSRTHSAGIFGGTFLKNFTGGGSYSYSYGVSVSESYSEAVAKAVTNGESIALEVQNSFALELMSYADKAINRLKAGLHNGVWQMVICYSASSERSRNIIKACLCSELSRPDPDNLPLLAFEPENSADDKQELLIPKFLRDADSLQNPLCSYVNSTELGLLCTLPTDSVPDFELRITRRFPMIKSDTRAFESIGCISDGKRRLENMPFGLSSADLNKHTFVTGMTGSGKSTTVKRILINSGKPFMVIESAKKEYRNIPLDGVAVYTLGKPELNCPQMNPFYIMPGVSPQTHIDYLIDLFVASFSFYGPMPYILEKCLHNVYINKGWNLTLGFHPMLVNTQSKVDFFDFNHIRSQYAKSSHRYLFPTMKDLKDEIDRYVREELEYEREVAGNIKTAMQVRLDNLCSGAKGFMFNTHEYLDMAELLNNRTVFELEGLADDSDKAFCVGLMIIFVNEYRQTAKESLGSRRAELSHLLVIEEAHRLLKNVDTERSSESFGNPKGKAVEHFANMIAEMRSYGQGVIVAEQIPSKLAPDVIKNSSNKIIQRIVAADDQQLVAGTIGLSAEDAIQIGTLETGYALCHKEGMALPVFVSIDPVDDHYVNDELLYYQDIDQRSQKVNFSAASKILQEDETVKTVILTFLNTLLSESAELAVRACEVTMTQLTSILKRNGFVLVMAGTVSGCVTQFVVSGIINFLVRGVYAARHLPENTFMEHLTQFVQNPTIHSATELKRRFGALYGHQNTEQYSRRLVAELIKRKAAENIDITASVREFFIAVSDETVHEIEQMIKEGATV